MSPTAPIAPTDLEQDLLPATHAPGKILCYDYPMSRADRMAKALSKSGATVLGLSIQQSADGSVASLALATEDAVHCVAIKPEKVDKQIMKGGQLYMLLSGDKSIILVGFHMASLVVSVHQAIKGHVRGVDLSTAFSSTANPLSYSHVVAEKLDPGVDRRKVDRQLTPRDYQKEARLSSCRRAWISVKIAMMHVSTIARAVRVDTRNLQEAELVVIGRAILQSHLQYRAKPTEVNSEFSDVNTENKNPRIRNTRYSNRVRQGNQVMMKNSDGREFFGYAASVEGKTAKIRLHDGKLSGTIEKVMSIGRGSPTIAEKTLDEYFLLLLRGERVLQDSLFIHPLTTAETRDLNISQRRVVGAMLSKTPLVLAHGPPGTGKTTTIAAAVQAWAHAGEAVWIAAQSNVAVKTIAESLARRGVGFKLLVSKEFYAEWHEHLYAAVRETLVRSDEVPPPGPELEEVLGDATVVLCTLSMLVSAVVMDVQEVIPLRRLVVDEASQIDAFQYMPVFDQFNLEKVCFFGDPEQLPPYGQSAAPMLQSIFDMEHLRNNDYFLEVQYRMPTPLGSFISEEMYGSRLRSQHSITSPSCVAFVDVSVGEEQRRGTSWVNEREANTIVNLVRLYYKNRDFCVITPYDAQRALIERRLKDAALPWECVYNVDSFQGNEADYVLVSVVRTGAPGFLSSRPRMNVLLTRCRSGMVVATSRAFLHGAGLSTLLGRLCRSWETHLGEDAVWADWRAVADGRAQLPGSIAPTGQAQPVVVCPVQAAPSTYAAATRKALSEPTVLESAKSTATAGRLPLVDLNGGFPPVPVVEPVQGDVAGGNVWTQGELEAGKLMRGTPEKWKAA